MDKDYKNACWRHHGEQNIGEHNVAIGEEETGDEVIGMHDFLNDVFVQPLTEEGVGPSTEPSIGERHPEEVETFFRLLEEADQDLWPGCKEFKKLEVVVRLYLIKCLAGMPDEIFTTLLELIKRMLHEGDCLPESCYKAKKLINDLGITQLCSKKESEEGFKELSSRIALTLCQLEKIFPSAFFDIMVHLLVHLADETALTGPIPYRWMYLQTLKRYVCNKGRPDGSIAKAYLVDECLSFCSMYLRGVESRRTRRGRNEDGIGRGVSGGLSIFDSKGCYMGSGEHVELDVNALDQCHIYILNNCDEVNPFRSQREEFLKTKHRREMLTMRQIKELSKKEFPEWFKQHMNSSYHANDTLISKDLHWLANYPSRVVSRYKSHIVHGFRFRIKSVDDKHKNQNCGVFVPANVLGAIGQVNCYGRVVDMFEVKYCGPTEAGDRGRVVMLFKCEWVNSESPRGMKTDQYGFTMVNFNQLGFKEDPFILASQALQAFYVEDTIEKDWHVIVRTQPRDLFDVLEDSDAIDDYAIPNLDDRILDNENFHTRVGVEETHFLESLALLTEFVNHANVDDELTDDDGE
ncbi:unnamed protein product [Malus baccata var. baccata]